MDEFAKHLVPDGLWEITAPLIGQHAKRAQGGGIARVEDRTVFTAIVFVLTTGCAWRHLPPTFTVSHQTAHRRFTEWSEDALWAKLQRAVLDRLGAEVRKCRRNGFRLGGQVAVELLGGERCPQSVGIEGSVTSPTRMAAPRGRRDGLLVG